MAWLNTRLNWFFLNLYLILFGIFFTLSTHQFILPTLNSSRKLDLLLEQAAQLKEKGAVQKALDIYFQTSLLITAPPGDPEGWQRLGFPVHQVVLSHLDKKDIVYLAMATEGYGGIGAYFPQEKKRRLYILLPPGKCKPGWYGEILKTGAISQKGAAEVIWAVNGGAGPYYFQPYICKWQRGNFHETWHYKRPLFFGSFRIEKPGSFLLEEARPEAGVFRETVLSHHIRIIRHYQWVNNTWQNTKQEPVQDTYFYLNRLISSLFKQDLNRASLYIDKNFYVQLNRDRVTWPEAYQILLPLWSDKTIFEEVHPTKLPIPPNLPVCFCFSTGDGKKQTAFYCIGTTTDAPPKIAFLRRIY